MPFFENVKSKVALVTHDAQTIQGKAGGVGAFVTHFARLLRQAGDDVTIILTRQETHPVRIDEKWRLRYAEWGIGLVEIHNAAPDPDTWCEPWAARLSKLVAPHLDGFDIAYFQDWANVAFHAARVKKYSDRPMPLLVTVLHGPSGWVRVGNEGYPDVPEDLFLDYIERYAAKHSDLVVSPSRYMVEWTAANGWEPADTPAVLGLPYGTAARAGTAPARGTTARLIFFGRLQPRKGVSLFVAALRLLCQTDPGALDGVTEIVFLGQEQEAGLLEGVRQDLAGLGIPVLHYGEFDSEQAGEFLAAHAGESLVVVPSPAENFPYAVIEASSIPGINLLCSQGGGIPEVLGEGGEAHLFEPFPLGLAEKLAERLRTPSLAESLRPYDAEAANERWLRFHRAALAGRRPAAPKATGTVDVCVPYFNKPQYLHQLLTALERQTVDGFGVIVIDDGSDAAARAEFERLRAQYADRGWRFQSQPNAFVDAARNRAASLSSADYLLFIDADDIPAPNAVERMLEAITRSGDDCLVASGILMDGDVLPPAAPALARYMPLGPDLLCALAEPMVLGPSMILVRRSAFTEIGGYRTKRGAAHEDWELQIRLVLRHFRVDVLPEYLLYFRKTETGLSQTSAEFPAKLRLIETYDDALAEVGLRGFAGTFVSLLRRRAELEAAVKENEAARGRRLHGLVGEMLRRRTEGR